MRHTALGFAAALFVAPTEATHTSATAAAIRTAIISRGLPPRPLRSPIGQGYCEGVSRIG